MAACVVCAGCFLRQKAAGYASSSGNTTVSIILKGSGAYTAWGTVAGITPRGVFVELDNTVEGFVPAAQLCKGEPQVIDGVSMLDPLTGKSWMLGSSMKIQVAAADVALGRIDFEYMVE